MATMKVPKNPRRRHCSGLSLCFVIVIASLSGLDVRAQLVPPVVQGFPRDLSCTPGQLLSRQVDLGRVTNIAYHNAHLYTNNVTGANLREFVFTDINDPGSLTLVDDTNVPTLADQGNHTHTKVGDYVGGYFGMSIHRQSPGVNNIDGGLEWFNDIQFYPEGSGGAVIYYPWKVPFNWLQYGPTPGEARLWRADRLLASWNPLAEHGVAGTSILIGNLLFVVSDASMLGVLAYDIGPTFQNPPQNPALLDKFTGPVGAYIAGIWENYLVLAGGANQNKVYVIDFSDPTDLRLAATIDATGTPALDAGSNVPYVKTQDEFVFARRLKINMETLQPVLELDEVGDNRPAGSLSGALDVSQYMLPLGQFLVTGSYSFEGRDGVGVWCHQATPDRRAPYVGYHIPQPAQTNYPVGAPISIVIAEELESFTIINGVTVSVKPVGGQPVDAWTSFSNDHILTITPKQYLAANTTYEVVVAPGGIKDASGNGIEAYNFTFATGGSLVGGNGSPSISSFTASAGPVSTGQSVTYVASATDPETDPLQYRFSFNDQTPSTAWASSSSVSHTFDSPGHYEVKVQVRDVKPDGSTSAVVQTLTTSVTGQPPPLEQQPTNSSSLALDAARRQVWVVNPDNDSVTRLGADSRTVQTNVSLNALLGINGSVHPTSVAVAGNGDVWVTARDADRVVVLSNAGQLLANIDTGYGSAPQSVAISRDGLRAYVALGGRGSNDAGNGQLVRYETGTRTEVSRLELGPSARAIAVTADASRVFVSRFISGEHYGEVWEVDGSAMTLTQTIQLYRDRGRNGLDNGGSDGPGVPNYVTSLVLSPQQDWLWYTATKTDTNRGDFFRQNTNINLSMHPDSTVRPMLGRIDLSLSPPVEPGRTSVGDERGRIDIDNSDSASALVFSPRGDYAIAAQQGNDTVSVFDDLAIRSGGGRSSTWRVGVGAAPQGLLWDPVTNNLWSQNLMGRNVTIYPLTSFIANGSRIVTRQDVTTGGAELMPPSVVSGKRQFYFAGDRSDGHNAMSFEGYISCASCHLDGGHDGRVWDFTQRGEGLRNTVPLQGRAGVVQGNLHWTGNFDEIQDFILDILNQFGGMGFLPAGQLPNPALGAPNSGRAALLDDIADYVSSLAAESVPRSPYRDADGHVSAMASAGESLFLNLQCTQCHNPTTHFTDSTQGTATLHDVGTLRTSSGSRLGQPLTGIDTPGLEGLWNTYPYLHDGSAESLDGVFTVAGGSVLQAELAQLGGTANIPGYPTINEDSSFHGNMVWFDNDGDSVTFSSVDGGSGGLGAVEMRYWPASPGTLRLTLNGSFTRDFTFQQEQTMLEWKRGRFEDIPLVAGAANTITISRLEVGSWQGIGLDEITVTTSAERQKAQVHRGALQLNAAQMGQLKAYLLQLDGRDANGNLVDEGVIFRNGFD